MYRLYYILAFGWQNTLKRGVVRVVSPIFNVYVRNHIYGAAEAKVAQFYVRVEYIKC